MLAANCSDAEMGSPEPPLTNATPRKRGPAHARDHDRRSASPSGRNRRRIGAAADLRAWDAIRIAVLGRNGRLTALLRDMGKIPADQKRERGAALNRLKEALTDAIEARRRALESAELDARIAAEGIDPTLPPRPRETGLIHPISRTIEEIAAIFGAMGCTIAEGPDVESDWYNFTALNIPPHHPARADQDTFYLPQRGNEPPPVLRTQTSPVQIRTMLTQPPPIRVIVIGRTYRADHDATHSPMFHQCEGLVIDRDLTLGHLKGTLIDFLRTFFGISRICRCGSAPATSRSPSLPWKSISAGTAAPANSARATTGWRFSAAAWCIRACWRIAASIRASGRASPGAWASSASPC